MELWEEYGRNTGPTASLAQRRLARVRDESTGETVWGWRPLGGWPLENTRIYVGYDAANVLPGVTQADRTFGNQPSVVIGGDSYHSKFTAAHEYGHLQTMAALNPPFGPSDLDYCYDPTTYPAPPNTCNSNHTLSSSEWQAAAAIEGFADWYAAATWHDVDDEECGGCMNRTGYVTVSSSSSAVSYDIPRAIPVCPAVVGAPCPAGVSTEHDWVSALRTFRLDAAIKPGFRTMLMMLEVYYDTGTWVAAEASRAFWVGFDQAMPGHLGSGYGDWQSAAQAWRLNR